MPPSGWVLSEQTHASLASNWVTGCAGNVPNGWHLASISTSELKSRTCTAEAHSTQTLGCDGNGWRTQGWLPPPTHSLPACCTHGMVNTRCVAWLASSIQLHVSCCHLDDGHLANACATTTGAQVRPGAHTNTDARKKSITHLHILGQCVSS